MAVERVHYKQERFTDTPVEWLTKVTLLTHIHTGFLFIYCSLVRNWVQLVVIVNLSQTVL